MTDGAQEDDKPFEVRLSDEAFETYELDPPPYTLNTTKKELKKMYYDMVAVRYGILRKKNRISQRSNASQTHGNGCGQTLQGEEDPRFLPSVHRPGSRRRRN